jgi:hypothetical protein
MREMVIKEIERLLVELEESPEIYNWNEFSNLELLEMYGELRIDLETELLPGDEDYDYFDEK